MDKQNDMAQLRYLEEMAISLKRASFETGRIEDHHLPVNWNGGYLCRISGRGSVLYRQQDVDANRAQMELQNVIDIAKTTSEYMAMMERAPQLKARDLEGDYRILADFNGTILAGTHSKHGIQFVTWDRDYDRTDVALRWRNTGAAEKWDRKKQSFRRNPFLALFDYFIFQQRCVIL